MDAPSKIVIIGGGQAGAEAATLLRQNGFEGRVSLIGEEDALPYMRPPLSKGFLAGEVGREALIYKNATVYGKARIELRLGVRVEEIGRRDKTLLLNDGNEAGYDKLILAIGGRARPLLVPGANLRNIFYLRTIADVEALQPHMVSGRRLVIVGGGYVGLEAAAVAVKRGLDVTVLESAPRVLARVTAPALSQFYEDTHRKAGVAIRTGEIVSAFAGKNGEVAAVLCGNGSSFAADFVLIGIGLIPNTELAERAGLIVDDGIVVDNASRSSDSNIFAIGDCAMHSNHGFLLRKIRLESVPNALDQARAAAAAIMGRPTPKASVPWFWSDQYDLKLQMVGISEGHDDVVIRGETQTSSFVVFYLKAGQLIGADAVNRPGDFMAAKRLVGDRIKVSPARLADDNVSLKLLIQAAA